MREGCIVDPQLYESGKVNNIITFNGHGCSGKTTQSKLLFELNKEKYKRIYSHKLRSAFRDEVYAHLGRGNVSFEYADGRSQKLKDVEVGGIPTLPWLAVHFHLTVKPLMLRGTTVVLDHYLADYYADMLAGADVGNFQRFVREKLAIPGFEHGTHFYLEIDYETYQNRWREREGTEPRVTPRIFKERSERYQKLCELTPLKCINATACEDEVAKEIQKVLDQ